MTPPREDFALPHDDLDGWTPPFRRPVQGSVVGMDVWASRSGLEVMRGLIDGDLPTPPVGHLLGVMPIAAGDGQAQFRMHASGWLTSPLGSVEGGVIACLAEFAMAGAVQTTVPAGDAYAPTDLRVQFVRPVPPDGRPLTASATVLHRGRTMAVARAEVVNSDGKVVAAASGSTVILPGRGPDLRDLPNLG